ncbi:hypothetical protein SAMN02990966_06100 [Rhodospirillales bacterium URHD0017]|nr:hypothetical protein SAMN02990966_06100 [Rhodospirillales bacterium URHD0017]
MPRHICGADLGRDFLILSTLLRDGQNLRRIGAGMRSTATAVKTVRGAWRCPLHGGLSTGPRSPEGKTRIAAAARARWAAYRAAQAIENNAKQCPADQAT